MIKIFISHSSKDVEFVSLITDLLVDSLTIDKTEIRATSVPGFKLGAGAHTSQQLRKELDECGIIIGVLTGNSLASSYVLFELGAGWGLNKTVVPLLGPGAKSTDVRSPLSEFHIINYVSHDDLYALIDDLALKLNIKQKPAKSYSARVTRLAAAINPQ